jgi:hypothetical protein
MIQAIAGIIGCVVIVGALVGFARRFGLRPYTGAEEDAPRPDVM